MPSTPVPRSARSAAVPMGSCCSGRTRTSMRHACICAPCRQRARGASLCYALGGRDRLSDVAVRLLRLLRCLLGLLCRFLGGLLGLYAGGDVVDHDEVGIREHGLELEIRHLDRLLLAFLDCLAALLERFAALS